MMNTSNQTVPQEQSTGGLKPLSGRRPLQPRSVNGSSSPSPAKSIKTSKPKQNALKSRMEPQAKLSVVSENVSEWPCINKEIRTPSLESESSTQPSMFRRRIDLDEDMFVLKRANPVYESDDEEYMASPAKRQRTSEPIVLDWCERLSEDEAAGYGLSLPILPPH